MCPGKYNCLCLTRMTSDGSSQEQQRMESLPVVTILKILVATLALHWKIYKVYEKISRIPLSQVNS